MAPSGQLREELREVIAVWSSSQRRVVELAARFADSNDWIHDGAATAAHWLAEVAEIEVSTAREWIRVGRKLANLPATSAAFEQGRLSYSKARTLSRVATRENEEELLAIAVEVPAGYLGRALAEWMTDNFDPEQMTAYQRNRRSVRWHTEPDGMVLFIMRLPPWVAGLVITIVSALVTKGGTKATKSDGGASAGSWPSLGQQRADAIETLFSSDRAEVGTEVVIHVRGDGCSLDDGTAITDSVVERLAPNAFFRALIHDADRRPINASGRQRHPTARQKRVVHERDRCCSDCGSTDLLEYDHVPDFGESGRTRVDELVLRCASCHHRRHEADV
jgi:hypothetical protein